MKALSKNKLQQLHHMVTLVEGAVVLGSQNLLCDKDRISQFQTEKSKLARLFITRETDIPRHISQQQIHALIAIVKTGHELIPFLYQKQLIGATYLNDFQQVTNQLNLPE